MPVRDNRLIGAFCLQADPGVFDQFLAKAAGLTRERFAFGGTLLDGLSRRLADLPSNLQRMRKRGYRNCKK
jgi:hypothetical protein